MTRHIPFEHIRQLWQKENPQIHVDTFMDNYCQNLLNTTEGLKKIYIVVDTHTNFEYRKTKLEIA